MFGRDFAADSPWQKMGTDVTELGCSFGKACFVLAYDFCSGEIVAWSISESPNMGQQGEMLGALAAAKPSGSGSSYRWTWDGR